MILHSASTLVRHRHQETETKRGWKVFFGLLIWLVVMGLVWKFWPE
jgi:hypothetical protein